MPPSAEEGPRGPRETRRKRRPATHTGADAGEAAGDQRGGRPGRGRPCGEAASPGPASCRGRSPFQKEPAGGGRTGPRVREAGPRLHLESAWGRAVCCLSTSSTATTTTRRIASSPGSPPVRPTVDHRTLCPLLGLFSSPPAWWPRIDLPENSIGSNSSFTPTLHSNQNAGMTPIKGQLEILVWSYWGLNPGPHAC
nr:uncharacterized protein LOC116147103 isoform X4 [Camelus dromedarius]